MAAIIEGTIHGKRIDLDRETDIAPGVRVTVKIEWQSPLPLEQRNELLRRLCGAWASDPTINGVFEEIERERHAEIPGEISFDAAS